MAEVGDLQARLTADVSNFVGSMKQAGSSLADLQRGGQPTSASLAGVEAEFAKNIQAAQAFGRAMQAVGSGLGETGSGLSTVARPLAILGREFVEVAVSGQATAGNLTVAGIEVVRLGAHLEALSASAFATVGSLAAVGAGAVAAGVVFKTITGTIADWQKATDLQKARLKELDKENLDATLSFHKYVEAQKLGAQESAAVARGANELEQAQARAVDKLRAAVTVDGVLTISHGELAKAEEEVKKAALDEYWKKVVEESKAASRALGVEVRAGAQVALAEIDKLKTLHPEINVKFTGDPKADLAELKAKIQASEGARIELKFGFDRSKFSDSLAVIASDISNISKGLPPLTVQVEITAAEQNLAKLKADADAIDPKKSIEADADVQAAERNLAELKEKADEATGEKKILAEADVAVAEQKLDGLRQIAEKAAGEKKIKAEADVEDAKKHLDELKSDFEKAKAEMEKPIKIEADTSDFQKQVDDIKKQLDSIGIKAGEGVQVFGDVATPSDVDRILKNAQAEVAKAIKSGDTAALRALLDQLNQFVANFGDSLTLLGSNVSGFNVLIEKIIQALGGPLAVATNTLPKQSDAAAKLADGQKETAAILQENTRLFNENTRLSHESNDIARAQLTTLRSINESLSRGTPKANAITTGNRAAL